MQASNSRDMTGSLRTVEIKEDITSRNNARAAQLRQALREKGILYLNVMSSPGSGKTTLLLGLIERLQRDYRIGVIEADIDSDVDAKTISRTGVKTIQMHTGGACHITWQMSRDALEALGVDGLDIVILENIGNLVCPAEFDTGAGTNLVLLSVPEGDDKPLKYPLIYEKCGLVLINKIDTLGYFNFSLDRCRENIRWRNPRAEIIPISAKTGENIEAAAAYFRNAVQNIKEEHGCQNRATK